MRSAALALTVLAVSAPPAAAAGHDWTRFGFNAARSNSSNAVAGITAGDLSHLKRQDVALPGTADSSPVYLHDVQVKGKRRAVYVVTTSYGRTIALSASKGKILWTFSPPSAAELEGSGQITTASPVADPKNGYVYAASPDGQIHKLALEDGSEAQGGSWPVAITLDATHEKLSSSLNLSGRYVIATTAGFAGDVPPYQGHVALIDRDTGALAHVFNSLCSDRQGLIQPSSCPFSDSGIWARAGAVVVPKSHRILVTTGNGKWDAKTNWGDTVLELSPDATQVKDSYTPKNQAHLEKFDYDLGTAAPALLRSGNRLFGLQGGKDPFLRLLDIGDLNGHGHACACKGGELQMIQTAGNNGIVTAPATWRHGGKSWAFVAKPGATFAYRLSGSPPRLHQMWMNTRAGTSPVIAGGLLYIYDPTGGGVVVYRPDTGKRLRTLPAGDGHWSSPVVADGRVAIPVGDANDHKTSGVLTIYRKP